MPAKTHDYIDLATAARLLGNRRRGRPTNYKTVLGWAVHGLMHGRVKLHTEYRGGQRMTTREWIDEFGAAVALERQRHREREPFPTPAETRRRTAKARKALEAMGVK